MYGLAVIGHAPVLQPTSRWYARPTTAPRAANAIERRIMSAWSQKGREGFWDRCSVPPPGSKPHGTPLPSRRPVPRYARFALLKKRRGRAEARDSLEGLRSLVLELRDVADYPRVSFF